MGLFSRKPKVNHVKGTQSASDNGLKSSYMQAAIAQLRDQGKSEKEIKAWVKQCEAVSAPDAKGALS